MHRYGARRPSRLQPDVNSTDEGILITRHKTEKKIGKRTLYTERLTEHDLRAKVAGDAESLEHAQARLACRQPHDAPGVSPKT